MSIGASGRAVHSIYHSIHICDGFCLMNPVLIIIHIRSVFKYHISIPYSLSYYLFKDILNLCTYFIYSFTYSFHILIHVLVSYTHSCTHFIYSFVYSFHSYLVNYQNTGNKNRVREQTEAVRSSFLLFDLGPKLGDHHPSLVNNNHATLSG